MTCLDLELTPEPAPVSPSVLAARRRRALVARLGGGRRNEPAESKSASAERRLQSSDTDTDTATNRGVDSLPRPPAPPTRAGEAADGPPRSPPAAPRLDGALVVPAGALIRGYLRCRSLLLAGDVVGNVHCTDGPVVIRSGASLKGRLVASGDVYVRGTVGDSGGGAVISTRGKLTLAPGARVDGDVRSGWLAIHDGAVLQGAAKGCED